MSVVEDNCRDEPTAKTPYATACGGCGGRFVFDRFLSDRARNGGRLSGDLRSDYDPRVFVAVLQVAPPIIRIWLNPLTLEQRDSVVALGVVAPDVAPRFIQS